MFRGHSRAGSRLVLRRRWLDLLYGGGNRELKGTLWPSRKLLSWNSSMSRGLSTFHLAFLWALLLPRGGESVGIQDDT